MTAGLVRAATRPEGSARPTRPTAIQRAIEMRHQARALDHWPRRYFAYLRDVAQLPETDKTINADRLLDYFKHYESLQKSKKSTTVYELKQNTFLNMLGSIYKLAKQQHEVGRINDVEFSDITKVVQILRGYVRDLMVGAQQAPIITPSETLEVGLELISARDSDARTRAALLLLFGTGLRSCQILSIRISQLRVEHENGDPYLVIDEIKSKSHRSQSHAQGSMVVMRHAHEPLLCPLGALAIMIFNTLSEHTTSLSPGIGGSIDTQFLFSMKKRGGGNSSIRRQLSYDQAHDSLQRACKRASKRVGISLDHVSRMHAQRHSATERAMRLAPAGQLTTLLIARHFGWSTGATPYIREQVVTPVGRVLAGHDLECEPRGGARRSPSSSTSGMAAATDLARRRQTLPVPLAVVEGLFPQIVHLRPQPGRPVTQAQQNLGAVLTLLGQIIVQDADVLSKAVSDRNPGGKLPKIFHHPAFKSQAYVEYRAAMEVMLSVGGSGN